MKPFIPVILVGGLGMRLWPASTRECRKPFLSLNGFHTLFQETLARLMGAHAGAAPPTHAVVVAAAADACKVQAQAAFVGAPVMVLAEPRARNTAPAVAAAALAAARLHGDDAILVISPADHGVTDAPAFREALAHATADVGLGLLGAGPDGPSSRFGYAVPGDAAGSASFRVDRFVEKPEAAEAERLIVAGALWNMGVFVGSAACFLSAFRDHAPDILEMVERASPILEDGGLTGGKVVPLGADHARARAAPFDRAVMEKTAEGRVTPVACGWSDLGDWASVHAHALAAGCGDAAGNVTRFEASAAPPQFDAVRGCLADADGPVTISGLADAAVVTRGRDLLITALDRAQDVRVVADRFFEDCRSGVHHDPGARVVVEDAMNARIGVLGCDVAVRGRSDGGFDITAL